MFNNNGNRILYLRTFREMKPDHDLLASLVMTVSGFGKLVIVGPAEDEVLLRRYWHSRYGSDDDLDRHVEYIISSDDQWRRAVHFQISKADCILFYLTPKGNKFPKIQSPKAKIKNFEEYYSIPFLDRSTGDGLLHEIVYLRRLNKIRQTIVLCTSRDFRHINKVFNLAPFIGFSSDYAPLLGFAAFKNTPKGMTAMTPRLSAFDLQLVSLLNAYSIVPFNINQVRDSLRSGFSQGLREPVQRIVRKEKWRRKIWWWRRLRPDTLLGKSTKPRRLPPDDARKVIQFTNVEDLLYIPRYEITDVSLTEILGILAEEKVNSGCPGCGAPLSRIFFFVRSLHREANDVIRGRCQQCFEPVMIENDTLIWY